MSKFQAYIAIIFISILIYLIIPIISNNQNLQNNWLAITLNIVATGLFVLLYEILSSLSFWKYFFQTKFIYRFKQIRISCSYLFRIKVHNKYLLVKGKRINQYQPVGGVYKKLTDCSKTFSTLGVKDDKNIQIDDESKEDLRIRVPAKNFIKFLKWFNLKSDREVDQWREFCEELIRTNILSTENFPHISYRYLKTERKGIKYSDYYQIHEFFIYDIYELIPTQEQTEELIKLIKTDNKDGRFVWVEEEVIERLGYNGTERKYIISEHSKLII
jgi:hypothetical protein